ncbi:MAG: type II secretion system F family protein, partial [Clostridia bacterium]|nr:type II secretion system F family protein [Clostridia bacterium]
YTQLADLLKSGVPLLRSLELLHKQSTNPALKLVLEEVRGEVADGTRLAVAMGQHPKVFSELAVSMVRAGEEGSFLEDVLKRIASFTDHQEELKNRVALENFGREYDKLISKDRIKAINKAVPKRVSEAEPEDKGGK